MVVRCHVSYEAFAWISKMIWNKLGLPGWLLKVGPLGGPQDLWNSVVCVLFTYCRQANTLFSLHFHTTWGQPFRPSLYYESGCKDIPNELTQPLSIVIMVPHRWFSPAETPCRLILSTLMRPRMRRATSVAAPCARSRPCWRRATERPAETLKDGGKNIIVEIFLRYF